MSIFKVITGFLPEIDRVKTTVFKQPYLTMLFDLANYEEDFKKAVPSIGVDRYITEIYKEYHEIKVLSNDKYHVEYAVMVVKNPEYNGNVAFRIKTSHGQYTKFIFTKLKEDEFLKVIKSLTNIGVSFKYNNNFVMINTNIFKKNNMHDVLVISRSGRETKCSTYIPPLENSTPDVKLAIINYIQGHNKKLSKALRIPKNRRIKK